MALEIERKFLIKPEFLENLTNGTRISQGYIPTTNNTVVRLRVKGNKAYLTIKGEPKGFSCSEFEYEISVKDADEMINQLCGGITIDKTRYEIEHGSHTWEIDVFHGKNEGLMVAEVELSTEDEHVDIPEWIYEEVTGQTKYFNSALLENPFSKWSNS